MPVQIAIAYHSGYGHTQVLAQSVKAGADTSEGVQSRLIDVAEMTEEHWDYLADSDAIIFGSPTYMGAVSGPFKTFMDETSQIWFNRGWANKLAAGFTVSGSRAGDKFATLSQMATLAAQHGMLWVSLNQLPGNNSSTGSEEDLNRIGASLGVMAQANSDQGPEIVPPVSDHKTAQLLGTRVAMLAAQFKRGQVSPAAE